MECLNSIKILKNVKVTNDNILYLELNITNSTFNLKHFGIKLLFYWIFVNNEIY